MFGLIARRLVGAVTRSGSRRLGSLQNHEISKNGVPYLSGVNGLPIPPPIVTPFDSKQRPKIENPLIYNYIIESPVIDRSVLEDPAPFVLNDKEDPRPTTDVPKQAARLIVIRRRKMRRHKLKKLRKKMKFVWAKRRQKREYRKEKEFQNELMSKIREAEKFSAAAFAADKIQRANEVPIPKLWKGKRLPEFVIKELLVKRDAKRAAREEKERIRQNMKKFVSEYKV